MSESTFDYRLECGALQEQLADQVVLVTEWSGTEAVSQLYRFEITVAVRGADVKLEDLLDQTATLLLRYPDGSTGRWHGIITQAAGHGRDESYDHYRLTLEPRLARLGLRRGSDIYLDKPIDQLIDELLQDAGLTEHYSSDESPYDYRIVVAPGDLESMKQPFICQFEETSLDFLMRKLEFYGIYFWFEQGEERESVVFGHDSARQPDEAAVAVYYPRGEPDVDESRVVIKRLDRRVSMQPAKVSLRTLHNHENTEMDMQADADVPAAPGGRGLFQSMADHFSLREGEGSAEHGVSGETLATWRAQELAGHGLQVRGDAHTPGVRAGRFLEVSEYRRDGAAEQYYVLRVEHHGAQAHQNSANTDTSSYLARFVALPRWRDQAEQADPIQFRPARITPMPRVSRLVTGFVDIEDRQKPKRYAQPDKYGRYKIRLAFTRKHFDAYKNSAWLRMSTPYGATPARDGVASAGMHFPLREGTEVLIGFLNEDPDLPVIVGVLPYSSGADAPDPRSHILRTPGGSGLIITDGGDGSTTTVEGGETVIEDPSQISLSTPMTNAALLLGTVPPPAAEPGEASPDAKNGFRLRTDENGHIYAQESLLLEVPGHYKLTAGNVAGSVSGTEYTVDEKFMGAKSSLALAATSEVSLAAASSVFAGLKFEAEFGLGTSVKYAPSKDIDLVEKQTVVNSDDLVGRNFIMKALKTKKVTTDTSVDTMNYALDARLKYTLDSPSIKLRAGNTFLSLTPGLSMLDSPVETIVKGHSILHLEGGTQILARTLVGSKLDMKGPSVTLQATGPLALKGTGAVDVQAAGLIKIG